MWGQPNLLFTPPYETSFRRDGPIVSKRKIVGTIRAGERIGDLALVREITSEDGVFRYYRKSRLRHQEHPQLFP